jgi:hypothetical protein
MRCIGICKRVDENFSGECDNCTKKILRARYETERIVNLLHQDKDGGSYYAGHGYCAARSSVHFTRASLLAGSTMQLDARYAPLVALLDKYGLARAPERPSILRNIEVGVERLLGVLTELEQTPGADYQTTARPAEAHQPGTMLEALHRLSPTAFEHLVANLLKAQGYEGVEIVGGANDRGVDLICRDTDGSLIAVQCKRYDPKRPSGRVGAPVVQLLSAMALQRRAHRGILVTTATFTESARTQAYDFDIELIDGEALVEQLSVHPRLLSSMQMR